MTKQKKEEKKDLNQVQEKQLTGPIAADEKMSAYLVGLAH